MSDFQQMSIEVEVDNDLWLQIAQEMAKFDLINSEYEGLTLPLKILILSYLYLILMATVITIMFAALALGAYKGYNYWDSIKEKSQKATTGLQQESHWVPK